MSKEEFIEEKIINGIEEENTKTIRIVGPCSKWVEGEGWVTEIPREILAEKVEELVKGYSPSNDGFNDAFWVLLLACVFSGGKK